MKIKIRKSSFYWVQINSKTLGYVFILLCSRISLAALDCSNYLSQDYTSKNPNSYLLPTVAETSRHAHYRTSIQSRSPKRVSLKKLDPDAIDTLANLNPEVLGLIAQDLKPLLGVIVKTSKQQLILAVGPYFGGSHQGILKELSRNFQLQTILWGGELLVSYDHPRLKIHLSNETSDYISEFNKYTDFGSRNSTSQYSFDFLRGVKVGLNQTKWLKAFSKDNGFLFSPSYQSIPFNLDHAPLLPIEKEGVLKFSPEFKNKLTSLMSGLELVAQGLPSNMDLNTMKLLVRQLQLSARYFLHLSYNLDDEVLINKIKLFLAMSQVFLDDVQDFDSLSVQDIRDFQDLILTISNAAAAHRPNPIIHHFYKSDI